MKFLAALKTLGRWIWIPVVILAGVFLGGYRRGEQHVEDAQADQESKARIDALEHPKDDDEAQRLAFDGIKPKDRR